MFLAVPVIEPRSSLFLGKCVTKWATVVLIKYAGRVYRTCFSVYFSGVFMKFATLDQGDSACCALKSTLAQYEVEVYHPNKDIFSSEYTVNM